jgi:dipicolinate synthase subunit B
VIFGGYNRDAVPSKYFFNADYNLLEKIATNDALAGSAKNIGTLLNYKPYYFVPFRQDDYKEKPASLVSDFALVPQAVAAALKGNQIEPMLV